MSISWYARRRCAVFRHRVSTLMAHSFPSRVVALLLKTSRGEEKIHHEMRTILSFDAHVYSRCRGVYALFLYSHVSWCVSPRNQRTYGHRDSAMLQLVVALMSSLPFSSCFFFTLPILFSLLLSFFWFSRVFCPESSNLASRSLERAIFFEEYSASRKIVRVIDTIETEFLFA